MDKKVKDDSYRIQKIKFYCQSITEFTKNESYENFRENDQLNFAISFALSQIGEEATKLTKEFQIKHDHIPWRNIIGIRHRIVHDYSGSNFITLWESATESVPQLLEGINKILGEV